jgi:hypothetical protein
MISPCFYLYIYCVVWAFYGNFWSWSWLLHTTVD